MPVEVVLPKVDMDMSTGRITAWHVAEGATVAAGDVLFEIETDKAAMEIDAPASGVLRDVTGARGVDIPVGQVVARIYLEGEQAAPRASAREAVASENEAPSPAAAPPDAQASFRPATASTAPSDSGSVRATPLARRLARNARLELARIAGSGPQGRVVRADVEAAVAAGPPTTPATGGAGAPMAESLSDDAVPSLFGDGSCEIVPHDSARTAAARSLVRANNTIPHVHLTLDCEIDALLSLREDLNRAAPMVARGDREAPAFELSVTDLLVKAMAMALKAVPEANVSWTERAMVRHKRCDVAIAVSLPGGVVAPIVRGAEEKTLSTLSNEIKDLVARSGARQLTPQDQQGGTTTVCDLMRFGAQHFFGLVRPPQATFVAVTAGRERVVARNGAIRAAHVAPVTLSADHRAVDATVAAELMEAFRQAVEKPLAMLV